MNGSPAATCHGSARCCPAGEGKGFRLRRGWLRRTAGFHCTICYSGFFEETREGSWKALEITGNIPLVVLVVVLILFSAFFSGSETAYFSLQRSTVEQMRRGGGRRKSVASLLERPRKLLVTILLGNLLMNIGATSAVTAFAISVFGEKGVGLSIIVMTLVILIFGEISPKSVALQNPSRFAELSSPVYKFLLVMFGPLQWALSQIADMAVETSRRLWGEPSREYESRELVAAVEAGFRSGLFEKFETEILTNFFLFSETTVEEIQTPRVEVFAVDADIPLSEAVSMVKRAGYSRVPLYSETTDNIVGTLLSKELLRYHKKEKVPLRRIMEEPWFVPESKRIRYLLNEFINAHKHFAVVVDEHGAYTGIVALEDILEEIFGEIRDRREPKVKPYHFIEPGEIAVEGACRLENLSKLTGVELESEEAETVAGYLIERLGRIPREGESFLIGQLRFLVLSADENKVSKLKVEKRHAGEEEQ